MLKLLNYIDGEHQPPLSEQWIDNYDPSIGKVYSIIPDSDEKDIELALRLEKYLEKKNYGRRHGGGASAFFLFSPVCQRFFFSQGLAARLGRGRISTIVVLGTRPHGESQPDGEQRSS